jgi:hypothetical protein
MFLIKSKHYAMLAWAFVKKYWKYITVAIILIAVYLFSKRQVDQLKALLTHQKEQSDKEIDIIKKSYEEQVRKIIERGEMRDELMAKVEEEYRKKNEELDAYSRYRIEKLLSETNDTPDVIAKEIAKITGFKIYDK